MDFSRAPRQSIDQGRTWKYYISNLPKGIYFLDIETDKVKTLRKFIKN
ncbi:MAG: T9SS type A sorting domain-containing protein [Chlorobi bacterium]|nr:T9SS type A sorting domain-containing protein [Chlorobiota bacterium]